MLTGELRNQIDGIWNDFWSGGLSNPQRLGNNALGVRTKNKQSVCSL
jgi:hypothetical protein